MQMLFMNITTNKTAKHDYGSGEKERQAQAERDGERERESVVQHIALYPALTLIWGSACGFGLDLFHIFFFLILRHDADIKYEQINTHMHAHACTIAIHRSN